jgi:hypothetical protein
MTIDNILKYIKILVITVFILAVNYINLNNLFNMKKKLTLLDTNVKNSKSLKAELHGYHIIEPSSWPFIIVSAIVNLVVLFLYYFHCFLTTNCLVFFVVLYFSIVIIILFRDIVTESAFQWAYILSGLDDKIVFVIIFTLLQLWEYINAPFVISDGAYYDSKFLILYLIVWIIALIIFWARQYTYYFGINFSGISTFILPFILIINHMKTWYQKFSIYSISTLFVFLQAFPPAPDMRGPGECGPVFFAVKKFFEKLWIRYLDLYGIFEVYKVYSVAAGYCFFLLLLILFWIYMKKRFYLRFIKIAIISTLKRNSANFKRYPYWAFYIALTNLLLAFITFTIVDVLGVICLLQVRLLHGDDYLYAVVFLVRDFYSSPNFLMFMQAPIFLVIASIFLILFRNFLSTFKELDHQSFNRVKRAWIFVIIELFLLQILILYFFF